MPWPRPSLSVLQDDTASDITTNLAGADGLLRFTNLGVIGKVVALGVNLLFGYLDYIAKQASPFTATDVFLEAWAALRQVFRKAATPATGSAQFVVTGAPTVPAGTNVVRGDGLAYISTADATGSGSVVTVPLQAVTPGANGNADSGVSMTLGSAIANVQSTGAASSNLTGGADVELDDSLRSRMLVAYQRPPQGGAANDYETWALAVAGVTRAWVDPEGMGAGTVQLFFMMDQAEAAHGGFPQGTNGVATSETRSPYTATGDQLAVANYVYGLQPVTALVYASAPQANTVNFTIAGIACVSSSVKSAVQAAIAQVFINEASPGGVVDLSFIESAIGAIPGASGFVMTAVSCSHGSVAPGPTGNITSTAGFLATLGTVSFV